MANMPYSDCSPAFVGPSANEYVGASGAAGADARTRCDGSPNAAGVVAGTVAGAGTAVMPDAAIVSAAAIRRARGGRPAIVAEQMCEVDGIEVRIVRKRIGNLYLRIKPPQGDVVASAPVRMPLRTIVGFVRERRAWIDGQRRRMADSRRALIDDDQRLFWTDARRREAADVINAALPGLLAKWGPVVGRTPTRITLRRMTSRWGSCTPKTGRIRLNLQLGLMDPRFLEYVLVHEMTHLWEHGHGAGFQQRMDAYLPGWRMLRRELNHQAVL